MKSQHVGFLLMILLLASCYRGQRQQMLALLDEADSLNSAYQPVTALGQPAAPADSLLLEAARFYDRHGTPNERLRAYYLLGCAYRDLGQAPEALQAYQDAVDRPDTLSSTCDLKRLMAVYGQMADLYDVQNLPDEEIAVSGEYQHLALITGDTLSYIRNFELLARPYFLKDDTVKMIEILNEAHDLYLSHGYEREAVSLYGPLINHFINIHDYANAGRLVQEFEQQSALFDENGNIASGREVYFYIKGAYLLGIHQLDSAEEEFRRLISYRLYADAYRGLLDIYKQKFVTDSIVKYAHLYENAVIDESNAKRTEAVQRITSVYRYQVYQHQAAILEKKAHRAQTMAVVTAFLGLLLLCLAYFLYRSYRKKKLATITRLVSDYETASAKYRRAVDDLNAIRKDYPRFIEEKERDIAQLRDCVEKYEERWQTLSQSDKETAMLNSGIVKILHEKASQHTGAPTVTDWDWEKLAHQFRNNMSSAFVLMTSGSEKLSVVEERICMLLLLGFTNKELAALLQVTPQRITNARKRINRKIFSDTSSVSLILNFKRGNKALV